MKFNIEASPGGLICALIASVFLLAGQANDGYAAISLDAGAVRSSAQTDDLIHLAQKSPEEKKKAKKTKAKKKKADRPKAKAASKNRNKAKKQARSQAKKAKPQKAKARKAKAKAAKSRNRAEKTKNKAAGAERKAENKAAKTRAAEKRAAGAERKTTGAERKAAGADRKAENKDAKARAAKKKATGAERRAAGAERKAAGAERKAENKDAKARAAEKKADRSSDEAKAAKSEANRKDAKPKPGRDKAQSRAQEKNKARTKTGAKARPNEDTADPNRSQAQRDGIERRTKRDARNDNRDQRENRDARERRQEQRPDARRAGSDEAGSNKAGAKRRAATRQQPKVNARKLKELQARQADLQQRIRKDRNRAQRLQRQNNRLARQRDWLRSQRVADRKRPNRNFVFRDRATLVDRRRDRVIYSSIVGTVLGAAIVGSYFVYHNDDSRIDWRASDVYVEDLDNGWTRNVVIRPNGVRVITIRDSNGFIVRRYRVYRDNRVVMLYDNQPRWWDEGDLAVDVQPARYTGPRDRYIVEPSNADVETVYETIVADPIDQIDRTYTLNQILVNANLRGYMPRIDLDTITFATGSADIPENQLDILEKVAAAMVEAINANPEEVFLIEGYTDATGSATDNVVLSDERAASVANALTEYYEIPPENLVAHGYGEDFLKIETDGPEPRNRRVAIRRITPLLANESEGIAFDREGNEVFN